MNAPRELAPFGDAGGAAGNAPDGENNHDARWQPLWRQLQAWGTALGFSQIAVADVDLGGAAQSGLADWLAHGFHGEMRYMAAHGTRRTRPAELVPGTVRVITARMDYLPRDGVALRDGVAPGGAAPGGDVKPGDDVAPGGGAAPGGNVASGDGPLAAPEPASAAAPASVSVTAPSPDWRAVEWRRLRDASQATVSVYARGRDYHKVLRGRLQTLADRLAEAVGPFGHRVFTDSAPVMEVELAARSGIGWRGKHTLALHRDGGSMFFLGEIFVDVPLPVTPPLGREQGSCGSCTACIDVCPTRAIVAPYRLDARRCISYLTIEHAGPIPVELRPLIGNRIYGCDDCQLVCPWNKFARRSALADFDVREPLGGVSLLRLWQWDEADFLRHTEGSAIRRIGYERWQRNLAVALGNLLRERRNGVDAGAAAGAGAGAGAGSGAGAAIEDAAAAAASALQAARDAAGPLLREHIDWALA